MLVVAVYHVIVAGINISCTNICTYVCQKINAFSLSLLKSLVVKFILFFCPPLVVCISGEMYVKTQVTIRAITTIISAFAVVVFFSSKITR